MIFYQNITHKKAEVAITEERVKEKYLLMIKG